MISHSGFWTRSESFCGSRSCEMSTSSAALISSGVRWAIKTGFPRHLTVRRCPTWTGARSTSVVDCANVSRRVKGVDEWPDRRGDADAANRSSGQIQEVAPRFARVRFGNVLLCHVGHLQTSYAGGRRSGMARSEAIPLIQENYATDCRRITQRNEYLVVQI